MELAETTEPGQRPGGSLAWLSNQTDSATAGKKMRLEVTNLTNLN
jgi:hypothetical protein